MYQLNCSVIIKVELGWIGFTFTIHSKMDDFLHIQIHPIMDG